MAKCKIKRFINIGEKVVLNINYIVEIHPIKPKLLVRLKVWLKGMLQAGAKPTTYWRPK